MWRNLRLYFVCQIRQIFWFLREFCEFAQILLINILAEKILVRIKDSPFRSHLIQNAIFAVYFEFKKCLNVDYDRKITTNVCRYPFNN